ncbi:hypothetical protein HN766_06540 [Candidatus Poribacteria bacterium]|nr:hypothetical protein [Candidatus Poribacteria bacterium]
MDERLHALQPGYGALEVLPPPFVDQVGGAALEHRHEPSDRTQGLLWVVRRHPGELLEVCAACRKLAAGGGELTMAVM